MSTQVLLEKIETASTESIKTIEAEATAAAAAIKAEAEALVAKINTDAEATATKAGAAVERAALAKARQSGKLLVQTARREAFDAVMHAAKKTAVGDDATQTQAWADKQASLEMHLSKQLG